MKLTKKHWIIIGGGILVIILAAMGTILFQRLSEKSELLSHVNLSQTRLQSLQVEQLSSQRGQLEAQLEEDTPQLEAAKKVFSQPLTSTGVATILFDLAEANRLIVAELTSSRLTNGTLGDANLLAMSMSAKVRGSDSNLVSFISELNESFDTGVVKSVTITVPQIGSTNNSTADVQLVVYTYRGD